MRECLALQRECKWRKRPRSVIFRVTGQAALRRQPYLPRRFMNNLVSSSLGEFVASIVPAPFRFVRVFNGADDRARIEVMEIGRTGSIADIEERFRTLWTSGSDAISVNAIKAGDKIPYHTAVHTGAGVLMIVLKGLAVLWVDDEGEAGRSYYPQAVGSVFLCEDSSGRGHGGIILEDAVVMHVRLRPAPPPIPGFC
jgi:hypothetical protein